MTAPNIPPCQECGACCHGESDAHVVVTPADTRRLGALADELTHMEGHHRYMRMRAGRCIALHERAGTPRFACSIYDLRPAVCRELGRGSAHCLADLASSGHRVIAASRRSRR